MKSNFYKLGIVAVIFIALVIVYFSVLTGRSANTYEMLQPSGGSSAVDPSTMVARNQPQDGKPMRLSTLVLDDRARPVAYQTVDFAMKADFLGTSGVLDLGQAKTDNQGIAVLDYTPRISGQTELITSYGDSQTSTPITIANSSSNLYQATSGIHLPTVGSGFALALLVVLLISACQSQTQSVPAAATTTVASTPAPAQAAASATPPASP